MAQKYNGKILLNLDTEDDDELSIGCAGGIDTNTSYSYALEDIKSDSVVYEISIKGLLGGHSGMDIDKGRGNANKLMTRILFKLKSEVEFQLISFDGGSLRNAIPREATSIIAFSNSDKSKVETIVNDFISLLKFELKTVENHLVITFLIQHQMIKR